MTWHVWTDGSCQHGYATVPKGLLGWGGWAAIIEHGHDGFALHGRVEKTTNVRMEIHAAIEGLRAVPDGATCVLHTDCTTLLVIRDRWRDAMLKAYTGRDARLWRELAAEFDRRSVTVDLLTKGGYGPIHRRAHAIAGAEARGGLRNLPVNATPVDDLHRLRKGARRSQVRTIADALRAELTTPNRAEPLRHHRDCTVGICVASCPIWRRHGAGAYGLL